MSSNIGPNTTENGLVFGFDTGYPLVSSSISNYRFNKGQPTINLITNSGTSLSGWAGYGWSGGQAISTDYSNTYEFTATNGWHNRTFDTGVNSGGTIHVTFEYKLKQRQTTQNQIFVLNGTHLGSYTNYIGAGSMSFEWQTFNGTFTANANSSKVAIGPRGADSSGLTDIVYIRNLQVESKSHNTPFVNGTRSTTDSLLDTTGNHSINVSGLSFDSSAQIDFDGTDDRIDTALYHLSGSSHTEEVVVYRGTAGAQQGILSDLQYGFYGLLFLSNNKIRYRQMQQLSNPTSYPNISIDTPDTYGVGTYHIVGSFSSTNGFRLYVNGVLKNSNSTNLPFNLSGNRGINHIGVYKDSTSSSYNNPFDGKIYIVKCYNRELTQEEIKNNFNGLRHRFDL